MLSMRIPVILSLLLVALLAGAPSLLAEDRSPCADGTGVLIEDWQVDGVPGTKGRPARVTIECLSDGRIRHVVEVWKEKGQTWSTLFESTYQPAAEVPAPVAVVPRSAPASPAEPAASESPAAAAPAEDEASEPQVVQPQAARQATVEGSDVQAMTRELERQEIPQEQAPELVMASPLVLEIVPGEVDDYPEGTAWSTTETAGFITNRVVIKKVTAGRKDKGDTVNLIIGVRLFTPRRQRNVDLLVEALVNGEVVGSDLLEKVRLGLNIPAHGKDGLQVQALIQLPEGQFDEMFADDVDRRLRLTLTVPEKK